MGARAGIPHRPRSRSPRPISTADDPNDHFILVPAVQSGRFDFRHALIRDAIYASVPAPERRRLHARVADADAARVLAPHVAARHLLGDSLSARAARGTTGQARTLLAAANEGWRGRRRTWEGTWSLIDLATAEARSNRLAAASSVATEAADAARALGSQPLLSRALDVLRQVRARRPADEPWAPLTAREYEVSRHIAAGRTNAEIAAEIGESPKTVSAHVEHILAKLGVSRLAEIAAWAATVATRAGEVAEAR